MTKNHFLQVERELWRKGYKVVIGLDEVGRGAGAGPVVACAVTILIPKIKNQKLKIKKIIQNLQLLTEIKDSKKLSAKQREEFYQLINQNSNIKWGIGKVSAKVIDEINILEATKLAMKKAIKNLSPIFYDRRKWGMGEFLILDGNFKIDLPNPQKSIVKADERVFSCALASIIAKVTRDRIMKRYHQQYPQYGFDKHKGYLTKYHCQMLKKYGCCPIHRQSFQPIKNLL